VKSWKPTCICPGSHTAVCWRRTICSVDICSRL